jgi:hypothetical protein
MALGGAIGGQAEEKSLRPESSRFVRRTLLVHGKLLSLVLTSALSTLLYLRRTALKTF